MKKGEKEFKYISNCKRNISSLMLLMGLWPVKNPNPFYQLRVHVVGSSILIVLLGILNFIYQNRQILMMVLQGLGLVFSFMAILVKIGCYIYYREKIQEIEDILNELIKVQLTKDNLIDIMLSPIVYFSKKVSWGVFFFGYGIMCVLLSRPIIFMAKQYYHNIHNTQGIKYILHYPAVYPYHIEGGSIIWMLHFLFEGLVSMIFCTIGTATDNTFGYYSSHIIAQFRALNYEIANIFINQSNNNNNNNNNEKNNNYYDTAKNIKDIVVRHKKLLHCCNLLQTATGPIVLTLSVTTGIVLCTLIFQISKMENIAMSKIIWLGVYISYKLIQTLIYAWSGQKIRNESEEFRTAVYSCKWEFIDEKLISQYVLIMMNQRPVNIKACGILTVDATLFSSILNTSLSYFFLLRSLQEAN